MKKIIQAIMVICCLIPYFAYAQNTVSGVVKDADGGIPGVSVTEKGMETNGTVTNEKGEFRLNLK